MGTSLATEEEKTNIFQSLAAWHAQSCSHSLKIRKDFKLRPKLFACLGGDFKIGTGRVQPYFSVMYKIDEKLSLRANTSLFVLQRKMTASIGGATLDFTPHIGLQLDDGLKPDISVRLNNLKPVKLALGCLCVGIAVGLPVRSRKAVPVKGMNQKGSEDQIVSRVDCEVALGVQREGSRLNIPAAELNGIITLGPKLID